MNPVNNLMRKYLKQFFDDEEDFTPIEGFTEHFIDLQMILETQKRNDISLDDVLACQNIGFQLIFDAVTQRDLQ